MGYLQIGVRSIEIPRITTQIPHFAGYIPSKISRSTLRPDISWLSHSLIPNILLSAISKIPFYHIKIPRILFNEIQQKIIISHEITIEAPLNPLKSLAQPKSQPPGATWDVGRSPRRSMFFRIAWSHAPRGVACAIHPGVWGRLMRYPLVN